MVYSGLSEHEVLRLRLQYGDNRLPLKDTFSKTSLFFSQFQSPLVYILLAVAMISFLLNESFDAFLLLTVTLLNVLMGYFQELSSQKTLLSLRNILKPTALVIREGLRKEITIQELVPGDIVALNAGDKVPADGKLLDHTQLLVDESILTGESKAIPFSDTTHSQLHMGTTVLSGKGIMEVEKTGIETEMGKIGKSLSEIIDEETPLQKKLRHFSHLLARIIIAICLFLFVVELLYHVPFWEALRLSVILSVAAIPEGLPIAVTVILTIGMRKILKKQGLVKRLLSIETLGSTSVICTDKTGTLTEGKMRVVKTHFTDDIKAQLAMILANEQRDSLEIALWDYVEKKGQISPKKITVSMEKMYEEPFDSIRKYSLKIVRSGNKESAFILGAPEIVLSFCQLSQKEKTEVQKEIEAFAGSGLKVLGAAYKETGNLKETRQYIWLGLSGIEDPLRPGARDTIEKALSAGIQVKIVTGDYKNTAEEIARQLGFTLTKDNSLEGNNLDIMTDEDLAKKVGQTAIFSRVTPIQKLRIVEALQKNGEVVAMTGDGVNDAPALKKADIGVVVGTATEVAKEAGDLILLDGNFKTIVSAVEEGRRIFANLKKVVAYVLSNSFVEIVLIFGSVILNVPAPLTIIQILWIHLICDGPPDIALGFESKEIDVMNQRPIDIQKERILPPSMTFLIFAISIMVGCLSLFLFIYFLPRTNLALSRTLVFASVASVDLIYIFSYKNLRRSLFHTEKFFKNKMLFFSVFYGFLLIFLALYVPAISNLLKVVPLQAPYWIIVVGVGICATAIVELVKIVHISHHTA